MKINDHNAPPAPFSRTVTYLRKSRADGEESVEEVLARHERILQDYAVSTWGAPLPESRIFREVQSGETIAARPVMQSLIDMIQRKEADAVLVVELQRLSRGDLLDVGTLSRLFLYTGCVILTPTKLWNLADEYDRKFFEMELMHGNDYLEYTKRIMGRGRERSVRDGNYIGSRPPFGYERVFVDKRPTLAVIPQEAEVIRLIFELYAGSEHLGPTRIANRLNDMGLASQRMDHWTPQAVRNIIGNPVYIGLVRWNRRKEVKEFRDGEIVTTKPVAEDYILAEGRHEPIITRELWDRAQDAAKTRSHPSARPDRAAVVSPLAGLLTCSICGKAMAYKICRDNKTKKPLPPIFVCTTSGCPTRGATVTETLRILSGALRESLGKLTVRADQEAADPNDAIRTVAAGELEELEKQRDRLYDFLERGIYAEDVFLARMSALRERIEKARQTLAELDKNKKTKEELEELRAGLEECIRILDDPTATPAAVNGTMKHILARILYSRAKSPRRKWEDTPIKFDFVFK